MNDNCLFILVMQCDQTVSCEKSVSFFKITELSVLDTAGINEKHLYLSKNMLFIRTKLNWVPESFDVVYLQNKKEPNANTEGWL